MLDREASEVRLEAEVLNDLRKLERGRPRVFLALRAHHHHLAAALEEGGRLRLSEVHGHYPHDGSRVELGIAVTPRDPLQVDRAIEVARGSDALNGQPGTAIGVIVGVTPAPRQKPSRRS